MTVSIRNVAADDVRAVWGLNQSEVPHVGDVELERIEWFAREASRFRIAERDGELVGFVIALLPGVDYGSANYRWFEARHVGTKCLRPG